VLPAETLLSFGRLLFFSLFLLQFHHISRMASVTKTTLFFYPRQLQVLHPKHHVLIPRDIRNLHCIEPAGEFSLALPLLVLAYRLLIDVDVDTGEEGTQQFFKTGPP